VLSKLTNIGITLFFILTLVAIYLYPGGSQFNDQNPAFSWMENYWCELMVLETGQGKNNPGGYFAIAATFFAGLAVSAFLFRLPIICPTTALQRSIVRCGTVLCSFFVLMLFSSYHHEMLLAFCVCSFFTMLIALIILIEDRRYPAFISGCVLFLMTQTNHALYYLHLYKNIQPLLQKTTIALVLLWFLLLNNRFRAPISCD